jgi:hypothetical protein
MSIARQIARLNDQYIQGLLNADRKWFERHLADEFVCIEADGSVYTKAEFLGNVSKGSGYVKYRLDQVQVRIFGEVGVVQATGAFIRPDGRTGLSRYTDVYALIDNDWKVVSAQVTRAHAGVASASPAPAAP